MDTTALKLQIAKMSITDLRASFEHADYWYNNFNDQIKLLTDNNFPVEDFDKQRRKQWDNIKTLCDLELQRRLLQNV
jgi:hypothetical protein